MILGRACAARWSSCHVSSPSFCTGVMGACLSRSAAALTVQRRGVKLQIPAIELAPPESMTHEHLAYVHCPVCRQHVYLVDMYLHLVSKHKELNPKHCQKICQQRLDLYASYVGTPLQQLPTPTSSLSGDQRDEIGAHLPTLLESGGYLCNWCQQRDTLVHATRDQFLKHVARSHPHLDLDEVEKRVPKWTAKQCNSHRNKLDRDASTGATSPSLNAPVIPGAASVALPRRRLLRDVQVVPEAVPTPPLRPLPPTSAAATSASSSSSSPVTFLDDTFPCELCGKLYSTEESLLNHFQNVHPLGELQSSSETVDGAASEPTLAVNEIRKYQQLDAHLGPRTTFNGVCDLCSGTRAFGRPSALFAHLKSKHPEKDAEAEMARIISKKHETFPCRACGKKFGSQMAADAHFQEKHGGSTAAASSAPKSNTGILFTSTGARVFDPLCPWWCNDCEKGFRDARGLHGHMTTKHGLPTELHPCPSCKRVFGDVYSLYEHVTQSHRLDIKSIAHSATEATCETCERKFIREEDLAQHRVKHHAKLSAEPSTKDRTTKATPPTPSMPSTAPTSATTFGTVQARPHSPDATTGRPRVVGRRRNSAELAE